MRLHRNSLSRTPLILVILFVIVAGAATLGFYVYGFTVGAQAKYFSEHRSVLAGQFARRLEKLSHTIEMELTVLSVVAQDGVLASMEQCFASFGRSNSVVGLVVTGAKGDVVASVGMVPPEFERVGVSGYLPPMVGRKLSISGLITLSDGKAEQHYLIAGMPRVDPSGAVALILDSSALARELEIPDAPAFGQTYWVIDQNGTLILHRQHPEMIGRSILRRDEGCRACHQSFDVAERMMRGEEGNGDYHLKRGEKRVVSYSPATVGGHRWSVGVTAPYSLVIRPVRLGFSALGGLVGLAMVATVVAALFWVGAERQRAVIGEGMRHLKEKTALVQQLEQRGEELRISQEHYRMIVDSSSDLIWTLDRDGQFTFFNRRAEDVSGYKLADWVGKSFVPMIVPEDLPKIQQIFRDAMSGSSQVYEVGVCREDGSIFVLSANTIPIIESGAVTGTVSFGQDVTEQKQLQSEFYQAQKMGGIGRLAAGIAHDFNNLLTVVIGSAGIAMKDLPTDHPIHEELQAIDRSARRAAKLNSQLMAFTRQHSPDLQILNLNNLLLDFGKMLRRLIAEDIEMVVLPDPDLGLARADSVQIEQVLVNLAVNARDAMPKGGKLVLRTANVTLDGNSTDRGVGVPPGSYVTLAVTDTGQGMTEEVKAHCFSPFFTTKQVGEGTGLGLATCYAIVQGHAGYTEVESEVERGTTIRIYLPRVVEETSDVFVQQEVNGTVPRGTETVLLVEDDATLREYAVRILRGHGYTVLEAANGEEALRVARANTGQTIHLLLTDVVMPGMSGQEAALQLKTLRPGLNVMLMSGYPSETLRHRGEPYPDTARLEKPFTSDVLVRKVREALDQREAQSKSQGPCREVASTILVP